MGFCTWVIEFLTKTRQTYMETGWGVNKRGMETERETDGERGTERQTGRGTDRSAAGLSTPGPWSGLLPDLKASLRSPSGTGWA